MNYKFEKLTPINDVNLNGYKEAIDFVFQNKDLRNIAITGPYSSGKSSVIETYKSINKDIKLMHISLAHFSTVCDSTFEKDNYAESHKKNDEPIIEGKILNQLIHQIPTENIPQTNFKVKRKISVKRIVFESILFVVTVIALLYLIFFDCWRDYVNLILNEGVFKSIVSITLYPFVLFLAGSIVTLGTGSIIYKIIKIQKIRNIFKKVNFQGNEIEILEETKESYFDKYLNEVLYLFENSGVDAIVFEDIDRFDTNIIFERLREINTLVNVRLNQDNKDDVLRFIYLLRDDVFISKDRTKFFDFIIPVIPVVDGSNSYDRLISLFTDEEIKSFDNSFLQGLSLYIDDMRLLKNIYNEFVIYYNRLKGIELDCNKMFAIITYKNLFPRDFADLQLKKGFVYTIFNCKDSFVEDEIIKLRKKITEISQEIKNAQNEHLKTVDELNVVFENKKRQVYGSYRSELNQADQKELNNRTRAINNRVNDRISELEKEVYNIEQEIVLIKSKRLCDIITRENINTIFSITSANEIGELIEYKNVKCNDYFDLLKYLIRNGYIDETYADYMTYFYENSLSRIDKTFLRSVTDKKAKEYTYALKNPEMVVSRLKLVDFDQEEILNFDLLTYLLHTESHIEYLQRYIDQLKDKKNFKFVGEFLDETTELSQYIKYLNMRWPEMFIKALKEKLLTEQQIRKYSLCSICCSDDPTLKSINAENCLCEYISNARDYLSIEAPDIDKLINGFSLLDVCFVGFDYDRLNKELFHAVYEKSLYEINSENIQLMLSVFLEIKNDEDVLHRNYTTLMSYPDSAITKYVNQNIDRYLDVVLKMSGDVINDDEGIAVSVLNNSELTTEKKEAYISVLKTTITAIKNISDISLWRMLLDADLVLYSEDNIMDYFLSVKSIDKSLVSYINKCNIDLDFSKTDYSSECKEKLFNNIITCNSIENSKYEQIMKSLGFSYDKFDINNINDDKIVVLIDANIIKMNSDTLIFMRESYASQTYYFIRKNIEEYVNIMDSELFDQEELLEIITWGISDELKIKLLNYSSDEISIIGKSYTTAVCLHILNNNFMESDVEDLFATYEQWDSSIQQKIFNLAIKNITTIIDNPNPVSEKLKVSLLGSNYLDRHSKIELLLAMMPNLNEVKLKEILTLLDLTNYAKILDANSRPKFEINNENERLLTVFKEHGLICDYKENLEKEGYYKIMKRKSSK